MPRKKFMAIVGDVWRLQAPYRRRLYRLLLAFWFYLVLIGAAAQFFGGAAAGIVFLFAPLVLALCWRKLI